MKQNRHAQFEWSFRCGGYSARQSILVLVLCLIVGVVAVWAWRVHQYRLMMREKYGFLDLGVLALSMIDERADGTTIDDQVAYITSFDAFYEYVKQKRPEVVSARDAPNPFPGLLPGKSYGRLKSHPMRKGELLLWSDKVHTRRTHLVHMQLSCEGLVFSTPGGVGFRAAYPTTLSTD